MAIRPNRQAMRIDDQGEPFMSHKPTDTTTPDAGKPEKPHIVPVTSSEKSQVSSEKSNHLNSNRPEVLEKKLRVAEASLQQSEETKTNDLAETMAGNIGSNVDKIRDILFGGQMRDYDKRFKRIEERFNKENSQFREEMFQRLKVLEERIDGEIDTISEKTKVDRQERLLAQQDLEHEIKGLKNELNNRLTQMDEQFSKEVRNLRQQTLNKFQELALQLRQQNDNLTNLFNQEVAQLQDEKVNRADLAFFFNEIAVRLTKSYEGSSELE